ncbi:MAG: hypothetical protein RLZZ621_831 [Gemmatimonadota bacterium]
MKRPIVFLHGYNARTNAFDAWRNALEAAGWPAERLHAISYESLSNEVSIRDIAEAFDRLLVEQLGLDADAPFDLIVHSTGMLVARAWLTRRGNRGARRARLRHLIALAPSTFGSPLAHKGRSLIGALVNGRRSPGPDFLEAGDQVLDALELGSRFIWDLAHEDLFGHETFYDHDAGTPYVFAFCGTRASRMARVIVPTAGTDGVVRWAGCPLNARRIMLDLTTDCPDGERVRVHASANEDIPVHLVPGLDHGAILRTPSPALVERVVAALAVEDAPAYRHWHELTRQTWPDAPSSASWQQFIVRAIDERGDPVTDWNLQFLLDDGRVPIPFAQDVHVYRGDRSLRTFHVRLDTLQTAADLAPQPLVARLYASTGTRRVRYSGALTTMVSDIDDARAPDAGVFTGSLNLTTVLPGGVRVFHPWTTTFIELRLERDPLIGNDAVADVAAPIRRPDAPFIAG